MIKILHCIPSMGGGGAERQLCYMANQMSQTGLDVHVAYFQDGPNIQRLNLSRANVHRLACLNNYDPMIIYRLVKLIREIHPDIVQTWIPQIDILAGISSILTKAPFIISERASSLAYGNSWKDKLRIAIGKRADAIIANSNQGMDYWFDIIDKPMTTVIRNGIPFDEILHAPKLVLPSMQIDATNEVILFAGRYDQQKNLFNLLAALNQVLKTRDKAVAILFGNGPQKESLINLKDKYEVRDRIKILDYTRELWNWLKVADVFVSVSYFEGNPNTVLEAIASRCPVVISDIPEHREILNEDSSYFVPVSDTSAIAASIARVLDRPDEAKRKIENAFISVQDWSIESVAEKYTYFYNMLLNTKAKRTSKCAA